MLPSTRRLETAHLVVGYAMSRLDRNFLDVFGFTTWQAAFEECARALNAPWKSIKGIRDEYDPIHLNPRRGWVNRTMLPSRVRVADELTEVGDAALVELVRQILRRDEEATGEALDALAPVTGVAGAAAERLLTGRRAEDFVLHNCERVLGVPRTDVHDMRDALLGFDFRIDAGREIAVEVKGMRELRGQLLFTDREWREALRRRDAYWLIVVGNLATEPRAELLPDPTAHERIRGSCHYEQALRVTWRTSYAFRS